jgi:hypothetical protein
MIPSGDAMSRALEAEDETKRALHLVTQRDQPYGSERRCCEHCGVACGPFWRGDGSSSRRWTNDPSEWAESPDKCS